MAVRDWREFFRGACLAGRRAAFLVKYDFGNHAKWVTDTGKLAYRIAGTGADVYQVSAEQVAPTGAAGIRQVTRAFSGRNFAPMWSPDGKKIAYLRNAGVSESHNALCVQSVPDGDEQIFDPGLARCNRMFWSPDSKQLVLTLNHETVAEIGVLENFLPVEKLAAK